MNKENSLKNGVNNIEDSDSDAPPEETSLKAPPLVQAKSKVPKPVKKKKQPLKIETRNVNRKKNRFGKDLWKIQKCKLREKRHKERIKQRKRELRELREQQEHKVEKKVVSTEDISIKIEKKKEKKLRKLHRQNVKKKGYQKEKTMIIGGKSVEVAYYDGCLLKREDAIRLRNLRCKLINLGNPSTDIDVRIKWELRKAEKAFAKIQKVICPHCGQYGHTLISECPKETDEDKANRKKEKKLRKLQRKKLKRKEENQPEDNSSLNEKITNKD